jgi:glycosyltransferase involved in cell wall biosynthesis
VENNIMVSISCLTYNHEPYIREAIESFLNQKTTFPFEILIHDDASTDKTAEIIREYELKNPHLIKPIYQTENHYVKKYKTIVQVQRGRAKGKYYAMCEGDDYWTDPYKLQKQVDFLEANPKFSFCFHDACILNQGTGEKQKRIGDRKIDEIVDLKSLILQKNIVTASLLFKNFLNWSDLPDWYFRVKAGDYALMILLAEKGLGKYIPDTMSVYRIHEGGVWSRENQDYYIEQDILFHNELLNYFTDKNIKKVINRRLNYAKSDASLSKIRKGNFLTGFLQLAGNINLFDKQFRIKLRKILSAVKSGIKARLKI